MPAAGRIGLPDQKTWCLQIPTRQAVRLSSIAQRPQAHRGSRCPMRPSRRGTSVSPPSSAATASVWLVSRPGLTASPCKWTFASVRSRAGDWGLKKAFQLQVPQKRLDRLNPEALLRRGVAQNGLDASSMPTPSVPEPAPSVPEPSPKLLEVRKGSCQRWGSCSTYFGDPCLSRSSLVGARSREGRAKYRTNLLARIRLCLPTGR